MGGVSIAALDGSAEPAGFDLDAGVFPWGGGDVQPRIIEIVDVYDGETESTNLYDPDGVVIDSTDACAHPKLVWRGGVDAWCLSPFRRMCWERQEDGWDRGDRVEVEVDTLTARGVDPGEGA